MIGVLRRGFSGRSLPPAATTLAAPIAQPSEVHAPVAQIQPLQRDLYWQIGEFLFAQGLAATPENFLLGHVYVTAADSALVAAIDAATADGSRLAQPVARSILATAGLMVGRVPVDPTLDLTRIAGQTETRFDRFAGLVDRSRQDARSFGEALEANAAGIAGGPIDHQIAEALLGMTGAMIASTRAAEARLRATSDEVTELRTELAAARQDADTDALTRLVNRRGFDRRFAEAHGRAGTTGLPLSLAIVDIDSFKAVNDNFGHAVGDRVLQLVARTLGDHSGTHLLARCGGEEFALLFEQVPPAVAQALVDDARVDLEGRTLREAESRRPIGRLTFSAGFAVLRPGESCAEMLGRADALLYRAKENGRNRLEC